MEVGFASVTHLVPAKVRFRFDVVRHHISKPLFTLREALSQHQATDISFICLLHTATNMKHFLAILISLCALSTACAQSGTVTYNLTLTGSQILPPINDPTVGEAFLLVSFNTDSNDITYQLVADAVTELLVAHIHLPATSTMNSSVAIPLFQAQFDPVPGAATSGLIAAATVTSAEFVGPLEVLPFFDNVGVATVLSEYVQAGRAYAQIHTMPYPDGALRAEFDNSLLVPGNPVTPTLHAPITVVV